MRDPNEKRVTAIPKNSKLTLSLYGSKRTKDRLGWLVGVPAHGLASWVAGRTAASQLNYITALSTAHKPDRWDKTHWLR